MAALKTALFLGLTVLMALPNDIAGNEYYKIPDGRCPYIDKTKQLYEGVTAAVLVHQLSNGYDLGVDREGDLHVRLVRRHWEILYAQDLRETRRYTEEQISSMVQAAVSRRPTDSAPPPPYPTPSQSGLWTNNPHAVGYRSTPGGMSAKEVQLLEKPRVRRPGNGTY
jgi:hypothetical protein